MVETRCKSCGVKWEHHGGITLTCRDLQKARKQLIEMRTLFFVLCLEHLKPEVEFTPENLAAALLKRKVKS